MVLQAAYTLSTYILPPRYYPHAVVTAVAGVVTYAFAQGRTTSRERDLHARTIIVTGAFTPLGLTLVSSLASRGAHIIALSQYPLDHAQPSLLIPLLRSTTNNENIYAEYADLSSSESVRAFCTKYLTGNDQRIDALIFAHEYTGIGSLLGKDDSDDERRESASLATFLMITLLLPSLLVAPIERDIRIINVVNPFYAAVVPTFTSTLANGFSSPSDSKLKRDPLFVSEGIRSLRSVILTRHIQRVLNALPNRAPTPDGSKTEPDQATSLPKNPAPSNIISVSVSPGLSRGDTMAPLLHADRTSTSYSILGLILYIVLYPALWLLTKSPIYAMQSVLHALFLPTPFKRALAQVSAASDPSTATQPKAKENADKWEDAIPEEVLKPGALYRECSVVTLTFPPIPPSVATESGNKKQEDNKGHEKDKGKGKAKSDELEPGVELDDDGEYGGEAVGRMVWEWYEVRLKEWEAKGKAKMEAEKNANDGKEKEVVSESDLHPKVVVTSPSG